ncbi:hypothetical protein B0H14DRAFT_2616125 [Mycena olivaceomarginata]|nr:hypothetical protein B0H14DRAFT_2616125 [Mycena olivaceomarginata]
MTLQYPHTSPTLILTVVCGLCPSALRKQYWVPVIWQYNMPEHLRLQHSEYVSPQQPEGMPLPFTVWQSMEVSRKEELVLDVKEFLIPRKFAQVAPAVTTQPSSPVYGKLCIKWVFGRKRVHRIKAHIVGASFMAPAGVNFSS